MGPLILRAALLLATALPAAAQDGRHRTVPEWGAAGSEARARRLAECEGDEREARKADCANARAAEDRARRRTRRPVPSPDQMLGDPSYWRANPVARAAALRGCARGDSGLTARDCAAARAGR